MPDAVGQIRSRETADAVCRIRAGEWETVRDSINAALQARFLEVAEGSQAWPCDLPSAQFVKFKVASGADRVETGWRGVTDVAPGTILARLSQLEGSECSK
jgi:hypothetical protein